MPLAAGSFPLLHSPLPPADRHCGVVAIDALWRDPSAAPLLPGSNPAAIGAVQELLAGHGFPNMPGPASTVYGLFGPATSAALGKFQAVHGLATRNSIDGSTLRKLVLEPAPDPRAGRAYLGLALGIRPSPLLKLLSLISQFEGQGRFVEQNRNTDRAGLSFGIIQWAQRPGRLAEILTEMNAANAAQFTAIFGSGERLLADALLAHVRKPSGGLDAAGRTTDGSFDLIAEPWLTRFRQAALCPEFQVTQTECALGAFQISLERLRAAAPEIRSERGVAFLLDIANQFGDAGAVRLLRTVPAIAGEMNWLRSIAAATVDAVPAPLKRGVSYRRNAVLAAPCLSNEPFGHW